MYVLCIGMMCVAPLFFGGGGIIGVIVVCCVGCWVLGVGCWVLAVGCWLLVVISKFEIEKLSLVCITIS